MKKKKCLTMLSNLIIGIIFCQTASTTVNTNQIKHNSPKTLMGITFDARSGMLDNSASPIGYFTTAGTLVPQIDTLLTGMQFYGVRYPGNAIQTGFQWKKSIGANPRPQQNLLGNAGPAQSMYWGFDEFMVFCESRGLYGNDIQIMLPIYDSAVTYTQNSMNLGRVPYPAQNAADWVEYANAPFGTNWGGGIAWSSVRAANGHTLPYDIKTWNIGNEPWGPSEMNFDTSLFFATVKPIIDSMRSRDSSIHITLPATGPANSNWNTMLRKHARNFHDFYGISPHFFNDLQNVDLIESSLKIIIDSANAAGLKTLAGDFGYEINNANNIAERDAAMSWRGANFCMDMILMFSQLDTVERANTWAFGMPSAVWRPVRKNTNGSYSLLPVAGLYKIIPQFLMNQVLSCTNISPVASDGHPYSLRASCFANNQLDTVHVIALNRDSANSLLYSVNGLNAYNLYNAFLLTSDSLNGETIIFNFTVPTSGVFTLPPNSILIASYVSQTNFVNQLTNKTEDFQANPNPADNKIIVKLANSLPCTIMLTDLLGNKIRNISVLNGQSEINVESLQNGVYFITLVQDGKTLTKKFVISR